MKNSVELRSHSFVYHGHKPIADENGNNSHNDVCARW